MQAEEQAALFAALSHPLRLRILSALKEAGGGPIAAGAFVALLNEEEHGTLNQQSVNRHLVALKQAGLVSRRKHHNQSHYRLRGETLTLVYTAVGDLLPIQRRSA